MLPPLESSPEDEQKTAAIEQDRAAGKTCHMPFPPFFRGAHVLKSPTNASEPTVCGLGVVVGFTHLQVKTSLGLPCRKGLEFALRYKGWRDQAPSEGFPRMGFDPALDEEGLQEGYQWF